MSQQRVSKTRLIHLLAGLVCVLLGGTAKASAEELLSVLRGDLGLGAYYTHSIIRGKSDLFNILPYADFSYGRVFARVDTLGIKTFKLGYGYLELVGRVSQDGYSTDTPVLRGIRNRETSMPLGVGTLQVTPLGGFMFNAFHDVHFSKGNLLEAIYVGQLDMQRVTFYPMVGAEYQSGDYVRYYYGISAQEAASSQFASYQPGGACNEFVGLIADIELSDEYHLNGYVRRKWLGNSVQSSPLVSQSHLDTGYLSLSYRFR